VNANHGQETFLFSAKSRTDLVTTEPPTQWVEAVLSQGVNPLEGTGTIMYHFKSHQNVPFNE
jgi:hypothetical protein